MAFPLIIFFFRLHDIYISEIEKAESFSVRKAKLLDYLIRVCTNSEDREYLKSLKKDIEGSIEVVLRTWLQYVSFLNPRTPSFLFRLPFLVK